MAVTDAFSTSLKMIGVAADIYAGRWDGSKYNEQPQNNDSKQNVHNNQQQNQMPMGGPDTPEQRNKINELIKSTYRDGSKIFTKKEADGLLTLRMNHTAGEVIEELKITIAERRAGKDKQPEPQAFPEDIPYNEAPLTPEEEAGANTAFETN